MIFAAGFVTLLIAAAAPQAVPADQASKNGPVTLDGCVAASQTAKNAFTLDDDGRTYALKGVNVRDFVGKHVEVIGAMPKRLSIVGGLARCSGISAKTDALLPFTTREPSKS